MMSPYMLIRSTGYQQPLRGTCVHVFTPYIPLQLNLGLFLVIQLWCNFATCPCHSINMTNRLNQPSLATKLSMQIIPCPLSKFSSIYMGVSHCHFHMEPLIPVPKIHSGARYVPSRDTRSRGSHWMEACHGIIWDDPWDISPSQLAMAPFL